MVEVGKIEDVPESIAVYLSQNQVELRAVIATDDNLGELDWKQVKVEQRKANKSDRSSITMAFAGIAETGTVAMVSSPHSPRYLSSMFPPSE